MAGMLPGLFSPNYRDIRADQQDEENRFARMAQDPFQAAAYTAYSSANRAGQGLASAVGNAMGYDTRSPTQRNIDAVEAAKKQVAQMGFDPSDPKSLDQFYMNVVKILQQNGLVAEAADVAKEWRTAKATDQNLDLKNRDLARKQRADDQKAKAADERNAIARERLGKSGPEALQLLDQLDNLDPLNPNDEYKRKAIMQRLDQIGGQNGVKFEQLGDRVIVTDMQGNPIRTDQMGAAPMNEAQQNKVDTQNAQAQTKYDQTHASLQANYDAAVELYNHPGLKDAVGVLAGMSAKTAAPGFLDAANRYRIGSQGRSALAKIQQVQGSVFIAALADLKGQSSTGASGLGQLTEVEGGKIQNAKAALDPQQDYPSYRANLAQYIHQLESSSQLIDAGAQRIGLKTTPLRTKPLGGSPASPTATPAPQAPMTPPAAPAASQPASQAAPQAAIDYLKAHPELKDDFKAKYGYLPDGL